MAGNVSDEAFARAVHQMGIATLDQIEAARAAQADSAKKGLLLSLPDVLIQQGIITPTTRENIEKKLQAQQSGGIKQLGQYKLLKKLGEGGMGAVYLADDTHVGRQVAVKVLAKKHAGDAEFVTRFRREAKAAGSLNHVNIVSAYVCGEDQGYHYLAMEHCDGEPLDKILKRNGFLAWDRAIEVTLQVARGLKHAHEHAIVHRDIKPSNIMICKPLRGAGIPAGAGAGATDPLAEGFVAKILDLGLSKNISGDEQSFYTQTGVAVGTPHYISPEQAKGEKTIDGRADIYSLGATFYHLVTGQTPFQASTPMAIMYKQINEQLPNPQDIVEDLPDGVVHIIQRMMAKEPADRYASCKELLDDLELVIDGKAPSSQAIDVGKSSVAVARVARPRKAGAAAPAPPRTAGPIPPVGTRHHVPVEHREAALRADDQPEAGAAPPSTKGNVYIAAGIGALCVLVLVIGLVVSSGNRQRTEQEARAAAEKKKAGEAARLADETRKADEARLKGEAARLEEERCKLADDKRKAEEAKLEEEKRKLAEERRKLEEARLAAQDAAKKKTETPVTKVEPPPAQPDIKVAQPDTKAGETPAVQADARGTKAQQLFFTVLKETMPLLAQNNFSDTISLLERKAKDPALADAAELLKQEKADVEAVVELRRSAIVALQKQVGQQVSLKKGGAAFIGKVVNDPKPDVVTLDMGGAQMTFSSAMLSLEDVDQYAPRTGNVGADLRRRGIMYLAAGNAAKAKECFTKPQTSSPESYLDRITAIEMDEIEAVALKSWERAEKLFTAKDMKSAQTAYQAFERDHGKTQTAKARAATVRERYDAIEKILGPAPTLTLDLGGVKLEMVLVKAGEFDMGSNDGDEKEMPVHKVRISRSYYIGRYHVTVAQFRAFADTAQYQTDAEKGGAGWTVKAGTWQEGFGVNWRDPGFKQNDTHPAVVVTWNDTQEFCKWASNVAHFAELRPGNSQFGKMRYTVRLPTEAEWEYAARGPQGAKYPWGDKWNGTMANVADASLRRAGFDMLHGEIKQDDGYPFTSPGGAYKNASWCGAYDMAGNAAQWCQDHFGKYSSESPVVDPQGPANAAGRVLRGGCWDNVPVDCRSARRSGDLPGRGVAGYGFRVVVVPSSRTP